MEKHASPVQQQPMEPSRVYREPMPVKLSPAEMAAIAMKLVATRDRAAELKAREKRALENFKTESKVLEEEERRCFDALRSGHDEREVEMQEFHLFQQGVVRVVRSDTSEIVSERPMGAEERQPTLPIDGSSSRKEEQAS